MGNTYSCRSDRSLEEGVDQQTFVTLTEDPTLLEMQFGSDEVCRVYDYLEHSFPIQHDGDDNAKTSLKLTKKEQQIVADPLEKPTRRSSAKKNSAAERKTFLLKRVASQNPIFLMRWYKIMDILMECHHPNLLRVIIDIHDEDPDRVSFVMEACEGGHLLERHASMYPESKAKKIIRQILEVVKYLHSQNIIHGDLRAEWFQFESDNPKNWHIKLTDFSLAFQEQQQEEDMATQATSPPTSSRSAQSLLSTGGPRIQHDHEPCMHTIDPQILLNGRQPNKKGDMWSVGVIMFRLLSGERPFGANASDLIANMREGPTLTFEQPVWKNVSPAARDLIQKLLAVQPKARLSAKQALKHRWFSSFPHPIRSSASLVRSHLVRPSIHQKCSALNV